MSHICWVQLLPCENLRLFLEFEYIWVFGSVRMRRKLVVNYVDDQNSACVIDSRQEGKSEGSAS